MQKIFCKAGNVFNSWTQIKSEHLEKPSTDKGILEILGIFKPISYFFGVFYLETIGVH